jgi:hypothetical protein
VEDKKFGTLRRILRAIGLKPQAVDEIVDRIVELLSGSDAEPPAATDTYPYHLRDDFLTPAEQSFFLVLQQAVADWALICAKVSLGDLFYAKSGNYADNRRYNNKIDRKHVDFLLCDRKTARPLVGIELDDKTHARADRRTRDEFVERVFEVAGLPLVRMVVRRSYAVRDLRSHLRQSAGLGEDAPETGEPPAQPVAAQAPKCPKCASDMVLRTATRGAHAGRQFWGCSQYPSCRAILPVESSSERA